MKYRLVYGNRRPAMLNEKSLWIKAKSPTDAIIKVLGGCDSCDGYNYKVGKLFGTIESK